ncbi:MAG: hypothetical protein LUF33_01595 [Clostridiales bacterium]|nr:hypothetical protein [Clostridiales bacterium]
MFFNIAVSKTTAAVKAIFIILLCVGAVVFSRECTDGALNGLKFCFGVLIPSLLPFMAVSSFIVKSGLSNLFGKPFGFIMRKFFGLNRSFAPVILLSMIGGYPVGARGISALYKSGAVSKREAQKAAMFSFCAGPGFLINFVGVSLYNNKTIGIILCVSQMLSVIILGTVVDLFDKERKSYGYKSKIQTKNVSFGYALVEAAADSSRGILNICAFVVLFSAFAGIINSVLDEGLIESALLCLLEICSAIEGLSKSATVEIIAFAVGFGGLCVHFQIYSSLEDLKISKALFFLIRIIQGVITALLTHLGLYFLADAKEVFSTATVQSADTFGGTVISGIALTAVALCFLYSLKKQH